MATTSWEYRVERITLQRLEARLNEMDREGWAPASVSWGASCDVLLRRERREIGIAERLHTLAAEAQRAADEQARDRSEN